MKFPIRILTVLIATGGLTTHSAEAKPRSEVKAEANVQQSVALKAEVAQAAAEMTAQAAQAVQAAITAPPGEYRVGVDDILDINVLRPETFNNTLTVSPDGAVTFPYIGNVPVKDLTLIEVQKKVEEELSVYMKYPVVSVSLKESRSRMFYVYGEVARPGAFALQQGMTALRAVSLAGGFTKFGSASRVKVLRQRKDNSGNVTIPVDLKKAMTGAAGQDLRIENGDVVTVEEGVF